MKKPSTTTTEKTGVQTGTFGSMFGWASSLASSVPGAVGSLFKALRGSGAADGQSPYDRDYGIGGSYCVGSFDSSLGAANMLIPFTLPRYRVMSSHPTLALAEMSLVLTILAAETGVLVDDDLADDEIAQRGKAILQRDVLAKRQSIMRGCLQSLRYGFKSFENVFAWKNDGKLGTYMGLAKLKQLAGELVQLGVDTKGNLTRVVCNGTPLDAPYFTHIVHDMEDANWFGRSRHENARRAWANALRLEDLAMVLTNKVTGRAPYVGVPADDPDNPKVQEALAKGEKTPNQIMGGNIARALFAGEPVVYTNTANIDAQDMRTNPDLAAGKLVDVEFLDVGNPGPAIDALVAWIAAIDKMLVRAWLRPERATLESQGGASRADSESHGDMTIADAECQHESIVEQLNDQVIATLIRENCGEQYVGRIKLIAMPLQDETKAVWASFFDKMATDPAFVGGIIKMIGGQGIVETLGKNGIDLKLDAKDWLYEPQAAAGSDAEDEKDKDKPDKDKPDKDNLSAFDIDDLDVLLPMSGAWDDAKHPRGEAGQFIDAGVPQFGGNAKVAETWAKKNIRGEYVNKVRGSTIAISGRFAEKATSASALAKSGNNPHHFEAIRVAPQMIEKATWAESDTKADRGNDPNIVAIHRLYAPVKIGDAHYRVKLTVKERRHPPGSSLYTHELEEIEVPGREAGRQRE